MPNNLPLRKCENPAAPKTPRVKPARTGTDSCCSTTDKMCPDLAPRAIRMPISFVLCETAYDMIPTIPKQARSCAMPAISVIASALYSVPCRFVSYAWLNSSTVGKIFWSNPLAAEMAALARSPGEAVVRPGSRAKACSLPQSGSSHTVSESPNFTECPPAQD